MSAIRDVEANANPLLTVNKRIDALLVAVGDIYAKLTALNAYLDQDTPDEEAVEAIRILLDKTEADKIADALARLQKLNPDAMEAYLRRLDEDKRQPWISTDRRQRRQMQSVDGLKAPTGKIISPDGQYVGEDHDPDAYHRGT